MRRFRFAVGVSVLLAALVAAPTTSAQAAPPQATFAYAVTTTNQLVLFNVNTPGTILRSVPITGLVGGDSVVGIDVRPATGQLFATGSGGRLYAIDPVTGAATVFATLAADPTDTTAPYASLSGGSFGVDFNPAVDRLRVVSDADQNLRINPVNGLTTTDTTLAYAAGDPNAASNPNVVGAGYTNNVPGTATTTLFDIDSNLDVLAIQNPPNNGTLNTVGPLGVNTTADVGFDIVTVSGANSAYASLTPTGSTVSNLYTVNLATGATTVVGTIGGGQVVRGLAIASGAAACTVPAGTPGVIFATPGQPTIGTSGADVICGTAGDDRIVGQGGDDLIVGQGGNDAITGDGGNDMIQGGDGNDRIVGGTGDDVLIGDAGNDDLSGDDGTDQLFGNAGADRLSGGAGSDACRSNNDTPGDQAAGCES